MKIKTRLIVLLLATIAPAAFSQSSAIQSCYVAKLPAPNAAINQDLYILIDQTTVLDTQLKQQIANQIRPFLIHGNSFSVLTFSSYSQGKYTQLLVTGVLEPKLETEVRNDISKPLLNKFDLCMSRQAPIATQAIGAALRYAFDGTSNQLARSDILASLKEISSRIKQSTARTKIVLLVSDMLENSSISSFYQSQSVRKIVSEHEIKLVETNKFFGDFGGARVYVMGAGLIEEDARNKNGSYREPQTMMALQNFWREYFDKSNAQLIEFGQPALLNAIR
jgi:hypothetical protein